MDGLTLRALQARAALTPGGRDLEERPLLLVPVPAQPHPHAKENLAAALRYLLSMYSERTRSGGLTVVVDAQRGSWRVARACIRQLTDTLTSGGELASLIVLRPEAFWDKQRVETCARSHKEGQAVYIPRARLSKYVASSQLPEELGGQYIYNHTKWLENRMKVEEFVRDAAEALSDLEQLKQHLVSSRDVRASEIETTLNTSCDMNESNRMLVHSVTETGKELLQNIEYENRNRKLDSEFEAMSTPQDILDTIERLESILSNIQSKKTEIDHAWVQMERCFGDAKDLSVLAEGVARVTNWILGPAEMLLNSQQRVGFDVSSAEELRREHESLELQCWDTYGQYAELLHRIDAFPSSDSSVQLKDLVSQRDFMDFVCRSFATRLERRRNTLITSLRFFRLVSEYFDRTSEVFELLVMGNKIGDFATAGLKLSELQQHQSDLEAVERELMKEGEKLSDILSMPVKDALGRDVAVNYDEDIANVRDILDATTARKNIFSDSVELQKLTLEQVTHINAYERDVEQACQWLDDLYEVLGVRHGHVGCNVAEIQAQKEEHQAFQETAKGTYNYGLQLLNAALSLRHSCKLPAGENAALCQRLRRQWQRLLTAAQEQMTRLRVSAVFHRSVDGHCARLRALREEVESGAPEDAAKKRVRVRRLMGERERLLVEVGRMVRLGRLLRTRLREPLCPDGMSSVEVNDPAQDLNEGNATAVESISERLAEVTALAEQLDMALRGAQEDCALNSSISLGTGVTIRAATVSPSINKIFDGTASTTEDWTTPRRGGPFGDETCDEDFATASECTYPQSRSSSFNSAADCGQHVASHSRALSPWWDGTLSGELPEDMARERMVLAVGCPALPEPKEVLRPSPDCPPGKVVHEVTETTHIKVQHSHTMGVSSFVLTSETVRDNKSESTRSPLPPTVAEVAEPPKASSELQASRDEDDGGLLRKMQEVGPGFEEKTAWGDYYHGYRGKSAIKGCI